MVSLIARTVAMRRRLSAARLPARRHIQSRPQRQVRPRLNQALGHPSLSPLRQHQRSPALRTKSRAVLAHSLIVSTGCSCVILSLTVRMERMREHAVSPQHRLLWLHPIRQRHVRRRRFLPPHHRTNPPPVFRPSHRRPLQARSRRVPPRHWCQQ